MKRYFIWLILIFFSIECMAQMMTQTVRGRVLDEITKMPLAGITVVISFPDDPKREKIGSDTDVNGYYVIKNVPVGRIDIMFLCIGYEAVRISNIALDSGKEGVFNVDMREDVKTLTTAVIISERDKLKPTNEMGTTLSARTFSVADAERYAGAFNDVSRMAQNFAGVNAPSDASNDIVIRGNSPFGLLWRLEGIDIFNPNHFSDGGATGGPISMINVNVLSNSDFYTSAFPAEYVNAYSGVFDLKLREGNYNKREYTFQTGINGVELGIEGPISKKLHASYLINYRYSFLDVLKALGFGFGIGAAVPRYQDWTVKLNIPTLKAGKFSLFSIGGINAIEMEDGESTFYTFADDLRIKGNMGVIGLNHEISYGKKLSSVFSLATSTSLFYAEIDTLTPFIKIKNRAQDAKLQQEFVTAQAVFNYKLSPKISIRSGLTGTLLRYKFISMDYADKIYQQNVDEKGTTFVMRMYMEGSYRPTSSFTIHAGINGQLFFLNQQLSIDPRISFSYKINKNHELNAGYGLHSQTQGLEIYLTKEWTQSTLSHIYPNMKLKMTKSHHFVIGYQWRISPVSRLKIETYYQYLYNLPVSLFKPYYCLVNMTGLDFDKYGQVYVSEGIGENMGIEFTFERFLSKGWYYLTTLSLYNSKYIGTVGSDNTVRNTRFNGNYVYNLTGGKEFSLTNLTSDTKRKWIIGIDGKFVLAGGQRYIPIDLEASNISGKAIYRYDHAYEPQLPYYMRADLKIWVKLNLLKMTNEFGFEARNITDRKNVFQSKYDLNVKNIVTTYQTGILPLAYYRITF